MELSPEFVQMAFSYGPIVLMVALFYFLLYKPQKKEQNRVRDMLSNLKKGDKIMTIGGLYGEISALKNNIVVMKVAEKVEIEVAKASISKNISQEKRQETLEEKAARK